MPNLFNSYLKRTPSSEIIKNLMVVFLVVIALYVVYENVISPIVNKNSDNLAFTEDIPFEEMDDEFENMRTSRDSINPVAISELFWNENPKRDPFSRSILIKIEQTNRRHISSTQKTRSVSKKTLIGKLPTLTGIIKGQDSNLAIIDGRIMKEGDRIRGFMLKKILSQSVKLIKHSQTITIRIDDEEDNV